MPSPLLKRNGVARRKKTGKFVSFNVGNAKKLITIIEEGKDACARPHSGIRLSVIYEVNENSH